MSRKRKKSKAEKREMHKTARWLIRQAIREGLIEEVRLGRTLAFRTSSQSH